MSEFVCKNMECSAPENKKKKTYPAVMECPFCDAPLVEVLSFNEADLKLINSLPYVIAYPLKRAISENHAWTKINLLKDTFLNYLKYLGLITASEFFNSSLKDKKMVALFQQALAEPSFGSWNQYIRETLSYLKENNHNFFCPDLIAYYELVETGKKRKLFKGEIEFIDSNGDAQLKKQEATAIGMLINFRNRYLGHGLTLDEAASKKLWDEYYPIFSILLEQLNFANAYPMFKYEHGETYRLQSAELSTFEKGTQDSARVWIENPKGISMDILPFFVVPGELSITKEDKEQILAYESYNGRTIKFFSPEGTEKQTSGKILEKLNLLLRDKQKEQPFKPESFTKEVFINRIADENKLILDTLISEKKYIPGVYVHREDMEIKLREWIGARANIFFIAAEAGSGKTNLLIEIQKQYAAQNLSVLFIRAARMEKLSLRAQIAYLLNIQPETGIEAYPSIAGTQANPTFVFIDGLNEAPQAASLWKEIIDMSKKSIPGSLKFVVSSRANSSDDLNVYILNEEDEVYLYGEKKDGHIGLRAYVFWLTALNMTEMKSAWEAYAQTYKNKYKPQFSFDDLATFDRSIYNLISNPLVLRIFLETYHNKTLPKKDIKHLNIWHDWLANFSEAEISFLKLLAQAVWDKGNNELLLDDLLNNTSLKPFLTSDLINAPYLRLKNLGWISRYVKDLNAYLSFTVEGSLLYLMGKSLSEKVESKDQKYIQNIIKNGTKIQQSAVEAYLIQMALDGNLKLVCELIDEGEDYHYSCNAAMLLYLKKFGVKLFIEKIFSKPTDNDWHALMMLYINLYDMQEHVLSKKLLAELMPMNSFNSKTSMNFGLQACTILDKGQVEKYLNEIDKNFIYYIDDNNIIENYGHLNRKLLQYDNAIECYQKSLNNKLKTLGNEHKDVAESYWNISWVLIEKREYDKALKFTQKAYDIILKNYGAEHPFVLRYIRLLGLIWIHKEDYDKALVLYQNSLNIKLKTLGTKHSDLADLYFDIGSTWIQKGEYNNALECYQNSLDILIEYLGVMHPRVANLFEFMSICWLYKEDYDKALVLYQNSLNIKLKTLDTEHPDIAALYFHIGICYKNLEAYEMAINAFKNGFNIDKKGISLFNIAQCYEKLSENHTAFDYYLQSAESLNSDPDYGPVHENTKDTIENVIRVARELNKENNIPLWMKNYNI